MYEKKVKCNYCESVFYEDYIIAHENGYEEICPVCNKKGTLSDDTALLQISGDRNDPLMKSILDLSDANKANFRKYIRVIPFDGYTISVSDII